MATYRPVSGSLPFASQAAVGEQFRGMSLANPEAAVAQLGDRYADAYGSALRFNEALYNDITAGYGQVLADSQAAQADIVGGYGGLYNDVVRRSGDIKAGYRDLTQQVLSEISGIGRTRAMDINDQYEQRAARESQRLATAGLGNSTVLAGLTRGILTDRNRSQIANDESIARMTADYRSQLGTAGLGYAERAAGQMADVQSAGLGYRERAALQNAGIVGDQLRWMNTIEAPYPDAGMYANLALMYGQAEQANRDRDLLRSQAELAARTAAQPTPQAGGFADPRANAPLPGFARSPGGWLDDGAYAGGNFGPAGPVGSGGLAGPSMGSTGFGTLTGGGGFGYTPLSGAGGGSLPAYSGLAGGGTGGYSYSPAGMFSEGVGTLADLVSGGLDWGLNALGMGYDIDGGYGGEAGGGLDWGGWTIDDFAV